jgi:probable rRNA maturation factor
MNESPNDSKRAQVSNGCPQLKANSSEINELFTVLDRFGGFDSPSGELSIAFLSKEEIARIHHQFMQDSSVTDVITFPGDPDEGIAGEICVCPEVAFDYAQAHSTDFSRELALYLAHGYLHLCGFDDIEDDDRTAMRQAETIALSTLEKRGAFPSFEFEPISR